jgi:N-acetylmuramoyl-L-alanine amidase
MELHFNAANEKARGTETLYGDQNPLSAEFARVVQDGICKLFTRDPKTNRGIKKLVEGDRGVTNVNILKCPSILIEPFFGDETEDAKLGFQYQEALANVLVESMVNFLILFGGKKK